MHLPAPSPPMRGTLLRVVAWLVKWGPLRDLILAKVRKDSGIPQMPDA